MDVKPARIFPFYRVTVTVAPDGGKLIEWQLNSEYRLPDAPREFYVEFSRAAGEWTRLNPDAPVVNECFYVDSNNYRCAYDNNEFYRVVLVHSPENLYSVPEPTMGVWSKRDWLIARDIVRKEYLRLRKYVGIPGYLLKRREHGRLCTTCTDFDLEDVVNSRCTICFGTRYIGGYYDAVPFYVDLSGAARARDVLIPLGTVDNRKHTGRAVAYPRVDSYDVWVDGTKNKRYLIRQIETAVALKGKPLVYTLDLRELPATAIEFSVPLEQDLSEYTGIAPTDPESQGWRRGISYTEDMPL